MSYGAVSRALGRHFVALVGFAMANVVSDSVIAD
ncbi:hypothetical protein CBM2592_B100352 [Cupriavidus taiwanensis]|nr:hypothetical protein CBM2592_B100352 [Cupriavidus taiwanensis]SOY63055.1 hypothetical protein CBM2588_B130015 [Cupriavidus taiwanensis]SOY98139.1 hypothetical protein CBM2591_B80354 [Cupriavidus taiwanensis]SOZ85182.1 hypothetical protein CBM2618_B130030 [Cupriavidus taiwanensis]SOZ88639.1 hypothetical protein CBM2622_B140032 [Cupriavidus taiwanensis]